MSPVIIQIEDGSRVSEARRAATTAADAEGLDERRTAEVAIVAAELATNLALHARGGELHISHLSGYDRAGVEILAIDRGPGMRDFEKCLVDGYSTGGTLGAGLGAVVRLSSEFDVYSQPDKGTVMVSRLYAGGNAPGERPLRLASVCVPFRGEPACGDTWSWRANNGHSMLLMADGLGHGVLAADASAAAAKAFASGTETTPLAVLETVHRALRHTRGAAVAVAQLDLEAQRVRYAGLGNIAGVILGGTKAQYMLSHNGTAGHEARRFQEFEYSLPPNGVLVLHSDGLATSWSMDAYPGLLGRHPAVIAGVLYRDATRGRDDACVVVAARDSR